MSDIMQPWLCHCGNGSLTGPVPDNCAVCGFPIREHCEAQWDRTPMDLMFGPDDDEEVTP